MDARSINWMCELSTQIEGDVAGRAQRRLALGARSDPDVPLGSSCQGPALYSSEIPVSIFTMSDIKESLWKEPGGMQ